MMPFATTHNGGLLPLDKIPWPLLLFLVDAEAPVSEREWALQKYGGKNKADFPEPARLFELPPLDLKYFTQKDRAIVKEGYTLQNILRVGGACQEHSYFTIEVLKAFGIPAMMFNAAGRLGLVHAWVGFLQAFSRGWAWDCSVGRYRNQDYFQGFLLYPTIIGAGIDGDLAGLARYASTRGYGERREELQAFGGILPGGTEDEAGLGRFLALAGKYPGNYFLLREIVRRASAGTVSSSGWKRIWDEAYPVVRRQGTHLAQDLLLAAWEKEDGLSPLVRETFRKYGGDFHSSPYQDFALCRSYCERAFAGGKKEEAVALQVARDALQRHRVTAPYLTFEFMEEMLWPKGGEDRETMKMILEVSEGILHPLPLPPEEYGRFRENTLYFRLQRRIAACREALGSPGEGSAGDP